MRRLTPLRLLAFLPLPLALLLRAFAIRHPAWTEQVFSQGLYPALARVISRVMAVCPIPVVEVAIPVLIALAIWWVVRRRFFRLLAVALLIPAIFLGGWGINYFRLPLEETLALPVVSSSVAELEALCAYLIHDANEGYMPPPEGDLLAQVPTAMDAAARQWPIPAGGFAAPKYALSSPLLSRGLIEGITSPFTAEALVNRGIPAVSIPYVACHETAHVRGFAREEDASLIAYLACIASDDAFFRYSGTLGAAMSALSALRKADEAAYATAWATLSAPVRQDIAAHAAYWNAYRQTPAAQTAQQVNDTYLRVASEGTQGTYAYGRVVDLLLALAREKGWT